MTAPTKGLSEDFLKVIEGRLTEDEKKKRYESSLKSWWKEYAERKNEEGDMVADSLLYDERCHLPRTTPGPTFTQDHSPTQEKHVAGSSPPEHNVMKNLRRSSLLPRIMHEYAKVEAEFDDSLSHSGNWVEVCCTAHITPGVRRLVKQVLQGFKAFQEPEAATDGMGGTYFLSNESGRKAAILKPCDEEALAPNNPKGYVGRCLGDPGWKPTVRVGEAALREVAAYLLDHDHFAKVPHTVLVRAHHSILHYNGSSSSSQRSPLAVPGDMRDVPCPTEEGKLGSLQEFVIHEGDTNDFGCSRFAKKDVHRIGILDVRLFNTDRHAGNILVRRPTSSSLNLRRLEDSQYELIPIDHGFCLPEALEAPHFEWLHWPQSMLPFEDEELRYIAELDSDREEVMLQEELPTLRPQCIRVLHLTTRLLQRCAAAGLSLAEIGAVMTRPCNGFEEDHSELERICLEARQALEDASLDNESLPSQHENSDPDSSFPGEEQLLLTDYAEDDADNDAGPLAQRSGISIYPTLSHADGSCAMASVLEDEELQFDLDEACLLRTKSMPFDSSSPGSAMEAVGATLSLSSDTLESFPSMPMSIHGGPQGREARSEVLAARSMQDAGHMWRAIKARHHGAARRPVRSSPQKATIHVYPPPVPGAAPQSVNDLFGDLDEDEWKLFLSDVTKRINAALSEGRWKQSTGTPVGVAMSCRF